MASANATTLKLLKTLHGIMLWYRSAIKLHTDVGRLATGLGKKEIANQLGVRQGAASMVLR